MTGHRDRTRDLPNSEWTPIQQATEEVPPKPNHRTAYIYIYSTYGIGFANIYVDHCTAKKSCTKELGTD